MTGQPRSGQPTPAKNSWVLLIWPLVLLGVAGLGTWWSGKPDDRVGMEGSCRAQIVSVAPDQSSVRLMKTGPTSGTAGGQRTAGLSVPADPPTLRAALKSELEVGDLVEYQPCGTPPVAANAAGATPAATEAASPASQQTLQAIEVDSESTSAWIRWLTLLGAAALLALFFYVVGIGPGELINGADNRYSKSKFQLVVWFGVAAVCYLSILWLRFCYSSNWLLGSVTIPTNLLTLSGLSALTFGGAKAITQNKDNRQAAFLAAHPPSAPSQNLRKTVNQDPHTLIFDLVHDDGGSADLGDFQMVFITLLAAVTYLVQFVAYLSVLPLHAAVTMPDVDGTMLAIFGLGHGAYLTKKLASGPESSAPAAGKGGPVHVAPTSAPATGSAPASSSPPASGSAPATGSAPPGADPSDPEKTRRIGSES
jgi:hypothetical protein